MWFIRTKAQRVERKTVKRIINSIEREPLKWSFGGSDYWVFKREDGLHIRFTKDNPTQTSIYAPLNYEISNIKLRKKLHNTIDWKIKSENLIKEQKILEALGKLNTLIDGLDPKEQRRKKLKEINKKSRWWSLKRK